MKTKRRSNIVQIIVLMLFGGLVVLSLVMPVLPKTFSNKEIVEVSVLMREAESSIWSNTRMGMEQAADDLDGELRFLTPEHDNSHTSQETLFIRELQGGADTLVVVPSDPKAFEKMISDHSALMPIVSIESPLSQGKACITPDNKALGQALASAVSSNAQTVLLLDTAENNTGITQRIQSCKAMLEENSQITVEVRSLKAENIKATLAQLVRDTKANVIIAFEPSTTEAIAQHRANLSENMLIYGVGSTFKIVAALEQGSINGVVAWSDYAAGYLAVQAAINAKRNVKQADIENILISFVKGEDIYEENNQKLLFPVIN